MAVPFEQIGPGQKGRLAFQIIGKDGPVFNPQNIRYLPPDEVTTAETAPLGPDTAIAGIHLLATAGTLTLTAATLREVRRLHKRLNEVEYKLDRAESKIDAVLEEVQIITTKVEENNLRHALQHVLARALSDREIDLVELGRLHADIEAYADALPAPLLFNFGVRLSTDVADTLASIDSFLYNLRLTCAQRHNLHVQGDPSRCVIIDQTSDCLGQDMASLVRGSIAYSRLASHYGEAAQAVLDSVNERFTFSDDEDMEHFSELLDSKMASPIDDAFRGLLTESACLFINLPDNIFEEQDDEKLTQQLYMLCDAWLYTTDAGLLLRTMNELEGVSKGYAEAFWPALVGVEPSEVASLSFTCALPPISEGRG